MLFSKSSPFAQAPIGAYHRATPPGMELTAA